jgi:2-isopropylmalate synthase
MKDLEIKDASMELNILRSLKKYKPPFEVMGTYRLIDDGERPEATVMLKAGDQEMHQADIGVGPVDALANVLKKSLGRLFPFLLEVRLVDFEVRMIPGTIGTSARVEVNITFTDGELVWRVTSSSDNINLASFQALLDGYEFAIHLRASAKNKEQSTKTKTQTKPKSKAKTKK